MDKIENPMKRINEKATDENIDLKKSKKDHPEYSHEKLVMPSRISPVSRPAMKALNELVKTPVDSETIVLSSDDEEEINMHKSAIAESLNLTPTTATVKGKEKVDDFQVIPPAVTPVSVPQPTLPYQEKPSFNTTSSQQSPSFTSTPISNHVPKSIVPTNVTMNIVVPNLSTPAKPNITIETDETKEIAFLDSSDDEEEFHDVQETHFHTNPMEDITGTESNIHSPLPASEPLSEVDELFSDTEEEKVNPTTVNHTLVSSKVEPMIEQDETPKRPVREGRNQVVTYNDLVNSGVDLNPFESDLHQDMKSGTKKRSTPPKQLPASTILNSFTRHLTSRRHLKTGFVYDTAMSYHATPNPMEIHPEDPRRIFKIFHILDQHGLLRECDRIPSRRATKEEILLVHNIVHYRRMRKTAALKSKADYIAIEKDYDSIYLNSNSFESGLYAVGSLIALMEAVIKNQVKNAFAIIRPPGHHAESDMAMGFCLFNNVAIATRDAMKRLRVKKTLILDWDVHFGNGTQQIFADDPGVLYISLHRYEDGSFYPGDGKGRAEYTGHGKGLGKSVNIPWPCAGMTDADYLHAFREVVIPIAMEFAPDVVIVSAGFDAAINDPIGRCNVTPAGYGQMTHMLKSIAQGKMVIALEGGYDLNSIAVSALACMNVLLGDSPEPIAPHLIPKQECIDTVQQVRRIQREYWNCLH